MARLLTFLAMIVGILLYLVETNACGRHGDSDHRNELNQLRHRISILEDEKYRILKENNAEKMKTKDEMASLYYEHKRALMETEDRLAQSEKRGQLLASSLIGMEEEFNAMMKKLKTCRTELPPTVEALRALREHARHIAGKRDDTILKTYLTSCNKAIEIAEKNLEKCETSTNEKDTKLDKWRDWYNWATKIAILGLIILFYVLPKVNDIMSRYLRTNQNGSSETAALQQQPLAINFRQNNHAVGNAFPNQMQNGHADADPRQSNQNFGKGLLTQMHHGYGDVHPEALRGPERQVAQTRQNRLSCQRSLFEGPEARGDIRAKYNDRNVYQYAEAAPSSHVDQGQQIPRNDKVDVDTLINQHGVSAEQTLRKRSVPKKSDTVPGRRSPERNENSTLSGQQPPRQLERAKDSDMRSMPLVQQPNSDTNTSASANASSSANQEDIGDQTRNGCMGESVRENTDDGTRNERMGLFPVLDFASEETAILHSRDITTVVTAVMFSILFDEFACLGSKSGEKQEQEVGNVPDTGESETGELMETNVEKSSQNHTEGHKENGAVDLDDEPHLGKAQKELLHEPLLPDSSDGNATGAMPIHDMHEVGAEHGMDYSIVSIDSIRSETDKEKQASEKERSEKEKYNMMLRILEEQEATEKLRSRNALLDQEIKEIKECLAMNEMDSCLSPVQLPPQNAVEGCHRDRRQLEEMDRQGSDKTEKTDIQEPLLVKGDAKEMEKESSNSGETDSLYEVGFSIDRPFTEELNDAKSAAYRELEKDVTEMMETAIGDDLIEVTILGFKKGCIEIVSIIKVEKGVNTKEKIEQKLRKDNVCQCMKVKETSVYVIELNDEKQEQDENKAIILNQSGNASGDGSIANISAFGGSSITINQTIVADGEFHVTEQGAKKNIELEQKLAQEKKTRKQAEYENEIKCIELAELKLLVTKQARELREKDGEIREKNGVVAGMLLSLQKLQIEPMFMQSMEDPAKLTQEKNEQQN